MIKPSDIVLLFSKKKQKEFVRENSLKYGFEFGENAAVGSNHTFLNLIVRAIIVYLCIIGSVDAYMSAFNLPYDMPKIMFWLALATLVLLFIQYNNITRLLGYMGFFYLVTKYFEKNITVIRSGLVAIINMSYELIQIKFKLPDVKGFSETITDRSLTVTTVIIVLGCYLVVVFWEVASRSMNLILTSVLTFTALSLGLYFDGVPSTLSILSLGTVWLFTGIIKFNSKNEISTKKRQYRNVIWKKNKYLYKYSDGKTMLQTLIFSFIFVAAVSTVIRPIFNQNLYEKTVMPSELKSSSDTMLKNIMILGFSRYKGYQITGRISNGQLGNYSNVRPDYKPDLEIEYLPLNEDTIYLKSFVGSIYNSSGWTQIEENAYSNAETADMTAKALSKYPLSNMKIKNLDVISDRPLLPYYTDLDKVSIPLEYVQDDILLGSFNIGETAEISYYPYTDSETVNSVYVNDVENGYRDYVYENYLQVPEENFDLISNLCSEQGWSADDENVADKIAQYFQDDFTYTLSPGLVPWKTDFVNYFLFENKEGVCAHFASAGTLIFRTMGIPARYIEGYALPIENALEGEKVDTEVSQLYEGDVRNIALYPVKATLSDYNAHGWVEIYKDGFGWVPVELTPLSDMPDEEEDDRSDQWAELISQFIASMQNRNGTTLVPQETLDQISESAPYVGYYVGGTIVAVYFIFISYKHIKRIIAAMSKNRNKAFISSYSHLIKILEYLGCVNQNPSHEEVFDYLQDNIQLRVLIEKNMYSKNGLSDEEINQLIKEIGKVKSQIIKKQNFITKIKLYIKV